MSTYDNNSNELDEDDKDEFEKKYHNQNCSIKPLPFVDSEFTKYGSRYVDTASLPKIDNIIYKEIERFPDYDYVNSIAFEMLRRTNQYKRIDINSKLAYNEKLKAFDKMGVDLAQVHSFNLQKVRSYYRQKDTSKNFFESYCDLTISDIDEGTNKLINYYLEKKQIYKGIKKDIAGILIDIQYQVINDIDFQTIISSPDYYIPAKFDYENYQNPHKKSKIGNKIPLVALEDEFLIFIKEDIPNNIKGKINFHFTRPQLRYKESAVFDIPINLNLSKKTILEMLSNLKDEYDDSNVTTTIKHLYNQDFKSEEWKSASFKVTKKSISKAFFVYDLYQGVNTAFHIAKNQLRIHKEEEIHKIEVDTANKIRKEEEKSSILIKNLTSNVKNKAKAIKGIKLDTKKATSKLNKEKNEKIKQTKNKYKFESQTFHTESVLINLLKKDNISAHMCKQYLQFMRKHIDNLKYKELIIGTELNPTNK